mgnify:CR=1 FL=1
MTDLNTLDTVYFNHRCNVDLELFSPIAKRASTFECMSGYLHLFEPSSTTFVKHYIGTSNIYHQADLSIVNYFAGYANSTSAINAIQFLFDSGNIDSGTIDMYGVL